MIAVRMSDVHDFSMPVTKSSNARFCCSDVTTVRLSPVSSSRLEYVMASLVGSGGSGLTSFVAAVFVVFFFACGPVVIDAAFVLVFVAGAAAVTSAAHVAFCFIFVAGPGDDTIGAVPCFVGAELSHIPRVDVCSMVASSLPLFLTVLSSAPFLSATRRRASSSLRRVDPGEALDAFTGE